MGVAQTENLGGGGGGHMPLVPPWFLRLCIVTTIYDQAFGIERW